MIDWYYTSRTNFHKKDHTKHALSRYCKHLLLWPTSTTMHNIIGAVFVSSIWSYGIAHFSHKFTSFNMTVKRFTITLTFLQAPILLLLTLRTNRALDRLLESRKAWGAMNRCTRSFMGLVCAHILPEHPLPACIMARYLVVLGWAFKGMLRNEDDTMLIKSVMSSVPREGDWLLRQSKLTGVKRPHAIIYRLRNLLSTVNRLSQEQGSTDLPPVILLRLEELLSTMESSIGICNR